MARDSADHVRRPYFIPRYTTLRGTTSTPKSAPRRFRMEREKLRRPRYSVRLRLSLDAAGHQGLVARRAAKVEEAARRAKAKALGVKPWDLKFDEGRKTWTVSKKLTVDLDPVRKAGANRV